MQNYINCYHKKSTVNTIRSKICTNKGIDFVLIVRGVKLYDGIDYHSCQLPYHDTSCTHPTEEFSASSIILTQMSIGDKHLSTFYKYFFVVKIRQELPFS
jgi:hypothetical protein